MPNNVLTMVVVALCALLISAAVAIVWLIRAAGGPRIQGPSPIDDGTAPKPEPLPPQKGRNEEERRKAIEARLVDYEAEQRSLVDARVSELLAQAIGKVEPVEVSRGSTDVVVLPSEDVKGRIVGKDGKNFRAFEHAAGVQLLIDELPGAVVVSSFDGFRRAVASRALGNLIKEGRIQPARIEESVALAKRQLEDEAAAQGREAAERAGVKGLPPRVLDALGRLNYRASLGQNVLAHSVECAQIASTIARELGYDPLIAASAAFLHDIGKSDAVASSEPHAIAGMRFLESCGIKEPILNAVGAHHGEIVPASVYAEFVIVADGLSATRPGARSEPLDRLHSRIERIEERIRAMPGVRDVYAVGAGRELRVVVASENLDDLACRDLADELAEALPEWEPQHGATKISVLREFRVERTSKPV